MFTSSLKPTKKKRRDLRTNWLALTFFFRPLPSVFRVMFHLAGYSFQAACFKKHYPILSKGGACIP